MNPISTALLVYINLDGEQFEQPLSDLMDVGTLIGPETGEDMALIGWKWVQESFSEVEGKINADA